MEPNSFIVTIKQHASSIFHATPRRSCGTQRRVVKPKFFVLALACAFLAQPTPAYAFSFSWVPRIFGIETAKDNTSVSEFLACRARNSFGTCIAYSLETPEAKTPKKLYRNVSSFGDCYPVSPICVVSSE